MNTKSQRGAELIEFAFVLPIFFALIFTVMQFGWLLYNHAVLTSAASTGAHTLATQRGYNSPFTDTTSAILSATATLPNRKTSLQIALAVNGTPCPNDALCSPTLGSGSAAPAAGAQASVVLNYPFTPIFGNWFGMKQITLHATMSEPVQ